MYGPFPNLGFLGTGATFAADVNLVAQMAMATVLIAGAVLARRGHYTAHGICQSTVLAANLLLIGFVMWPSFAQQIRPALPTRMHKLYYSLAAAHAGVGIAVEGLGLYIAAVAGTQIVPARMRFKNFRSWMRLELALWLAVLAMGIGTYAVWYVVPFH